MLALVLGAPGLALSSSPIAAANPGRPAGTRVSGVASGGSIAFIQTYNVWLTSPDGTTKRQLTTDGSASTPYRYPTQSDDGTVVVAVQDRFEQQQGFRRSYLYEMDRQGTLLRAPFAPPQYEFNMNGCGRAPQGIAAAVSPDGTKIVVNPLALFFSSLCGHDNTSYAYVIALDGTVVAGTIAPQDPNAATDSFETPSWVTNTRLLLSHRRQTAVYYYDLGASTATPWIASNSTYRHPSLRTGKLATSGFDGSGLEVARFWTTNGGPPAVPTPRCDEHPPHAAFLQAPISSLSPDGASVALYEATDANAPSGIYVSAVGNIGAGDCSTINPQILIVGGYDPYWGPAPVGAGPSAHPVADFDGDRKSDLSVFRPSTGQWFAGSGLATGYGTTGDIPVPGDYDGVAKIDVAVFRPSNSVWYIRHSNGTNTALPYGTTGDIPVPGAYGFDGKTNIAVFRPSTGPRG